LSERDLSLKDSKPVSLYIHFPFCRKRCNYCDFNTFVNMEKFIPAYVRVLCNEINNVGKIINHNEFIHTIFLGGGTPSVLSNRDYEQIFNSIRKNFQLSYEAEISMEVNPGTVTPEYLNQIFRLGVNRLSIGMQSSNPEELRYLGRIHDPVAVINTVKWARKAGFENFSVDLMFGLPGQTLESWQKNIEFALRLKPTHISLYSLTVEKNTPFAKWFSQGLLPSMEEDLPSDMYEYAIDNLAKKNFMQYEISNWAKINQGKTSTICKHNLQYWLNHPYLGIGAGAHSYYNHQRWENIGTIPEYIEADAGSNNEKRFFTQINLQRLNLKTEMQETMFMGLRLVQQGVSNHAFQERFGISIMDIFNKEVDELLGIGLVEWAGEENENLRLTKRGILLGNQVFMRFVD
jgi:oxygen-independent coproporphyrinogen III oxidase